MEPDGLCAISRYDDVQFAMRRHDLFSSSGFKPLLQPDWLSDECKRGGFMLAEDPPQHTKHRGIVNKAFVTRVITELIPLMQQRAEELVAAMRAQAEAGQVVDFVREFSYPYIGKIIGRITGTEETQTLEEIRQWVAYLETIPPTRPDAAYIRELEAALNKQKELNELQRQFVSMASHEFRTPLAIIDATAQRLKKRADRMSSDDALSRIDKIRHAVARMTQLMESTLTAARLEDGRVAVDIRPCPIERIIHEACARHQDIAKNHVISCDTAGLPELIRADANALEQILTNLLSNAVKYAPQSPNVGVDAYCDHGDIVIEVTDHGIGIDADDLPNMFNRFFRAKTSAGIAGTGIGLNLVKTLAEMHGGTVAVASTKGVGSKFSVRLPIDGPATPDQSRDAAA